MGGFASRGRRCVSLGIFVVIDRWASVDICCPYIVQGILTRPDLERECALSTAHHVALLRLDDRFRCSYTVLHLRLGTTQVVGLCWSLGLDL